MKNLTQIFNILIFVVIIILFLMPLAQWMAWRDISMILASKLAGYLVFLLVGYFLSQKYYKKEKYIISSIISFIALLPAIVSYLLFEFGPLLNIY